MFPIRLYSQYLDVLSDEWKPRSCGIVSLKMVLEYLCGEIYDADDLVADGVERDGFIKGIGWKHQALVDMANARGCDAKREDWSEHAPYDALERLSVALQSGPVIASVYSNLDPTTQSGHLVVVTGIEHGRVFYNDPAAHTRTDIARWAKVEDFLNGWKRRVILISSRN